MRFFESLNLRFSFLLSLTSFCSQPSDLPLFALLVYISSLKGCLSLVVPSTRVDLVLSLWCTTCQPSYKSSPCLLHTSPQALLYLFVKPNAYSILFEALLCLRHESSSSPSSYLKLNDSLNVSRYTFLKCYNLSQLSLDKFENPLKYWEVVEIFE